MYLYVGETDESEKLFEEMFPQNSARVAKQKNAPLRVIIGNPPYSKGQKSANDGAQNQSYAKLDARISNTYALETDANNKNALYNPYLKAFRWSTDRLDKKYGGIIAFVTDGGWLDNASMNGFRKNILREFSSIYVFNLRGDQRTSGELSRKEGGKIFGSGSRSPISITFLVNNPGTKKEKAEIFYRDIGDYLSREDKLDIIKNHKSINSEKIKWVKLDPNEHGDWLNQRSDAYTSFIPMAPEKKFDTSSQSFFVLNSLGVLSSRDYWLYNSSYNQVKNNSERMVSFYNEQVEKFVDAQKRDSKLKAEDFINKDPKKISWSSSLIPNVQRGNKASYETEKIIQVAYRPFNKQFLYFGDKMIHRRGQFEELYPTQNHTNFVICVSGLAGSKENSSIMTKQITDINILDASTQCFPLYYYEKREKVSKGLFDDEGNSEFIRRDGISDFILSRAQKQFGKNVSKEDIFYYVYGFLHNRDYRQTFTSDFKKMLPRLPLVEETKDFWDLSNAGRKLSELHINYENIPTHQDIKITGLDGEFYSVEKMRFPKKGQKDSIIYNSKITISNIPEKAYEYVVNGKSAIEWVMEQYLHIPIKLTT